MKSGNCYWEGMASKFEDLCQSILDVWFMLVLKRMAKFLNETLNGSVVTIDFP